MAYVKNIWVDQDVERPKTYEVTNNQDGSITLTDSFGLVTELGTPVNEVNMNHIEDGIDGCAIRKHNLTETFNLGEWVLGGTGDNEGIYKSLIANNVNNAITDTTKWEKISMGASRNIGEMVASTIPLVDAGLHLLDGALLQYGSYQEFIDYIAGLVTDYPDLFDTEANWQSAVAQYGVCGKFVYNSTNNTVRLPKITGIVEGTTDLTALGDLVEAGLPNIEGRGFWGKNIVGTGAVRTFSTNSFAGTQSAAGETFNEFDASLSNPIYGNSTTVQPQTIKVLYYIVIATSTKTQIQVDIDEIATDLNGKADRDGSNMVASVKNFDGGWINSSQILGSELSFNESNDPIFSLSNYLPNDNYNYEVIISLLGRSGSTAGNNIDIGVFSDLIQDPGVRGIRVAVAQTRTSMFVWGGGAITIPVGAGRSIGLHQNSTANCTNVSCSAFGYRRVGTNS